MEWLAKLVSDPVSILLVVLLFFTGVVAVILFWALERDKGVAEQLDEIEEELRGNLSAVQSSGDRQAQRSREEFANNLRGMGDSVSRVMSDMARTQQSQLDAFTAQLREMNRADEQRMHEIRAMVESRLASYEGRMERIGDVLDDKMNQNDARMERLRESVEQRMERMRTDNGRWLEEMRAAVDENLNDTLERRLGERFRLVSERLDQVYQGLGEMQSLANGVGDLKQVLTGVQTRGLLGEIQLGALLSQIMSPEQYEAEALIREGGPRVDYAVRLPVREERAAALLPIDAQFAYETYRELLAAAQNRDQPLVLSLTQRLEDELYARAEYIQAQFILPPHTTAFAVMFLPVEGLYAEALRMPGLSERMQREYGVTVAGPATLTALLNSLQMGFKTLALEKRSTEVWAMLDAVRADFGQFAQALARTQKKLRQASESIEDATRKSRTLERRLQNVPALDGARPEALEEGEEEDDAP